jgi:hypothetical protein
VDDGECKAGGDGSINGIASGTQHLDSGARGEFVHACNHCVLSMGGLRGRG